MKPLHICFTTTSFIRSPNDYYSYFIYEQVLSVTQNNPEISATVVAPHDYGYKFSEVISGVTVKRYPYFFPLSLQKLAYQTDGMFRTIERSKLALLSLPFFILGLFVYTVKNSWNASIIHAQWIPTAFIALPIKWIFNIPIVVSVRGSDLNLVKKSKIKKAAYSFFLNKLDMIFPVSDDLNKKLIDDFNVTIPVKSLYNGVNNQFFMKHDKRESLKSLRSPISGRILLFVGNILSSKGVDTLLSAMQLVLRKHPDTQLALGGEGPEILSFRKLAQELGITHSVHFLGLIARADIPYWMSVAEMLILPSRAEGRPNVVLEAMSCGLPVIATNVGGIPELIENEQTGLLFQPGDSAVLASLIVNLLENPEKGCQLANKALTSLHSKGLTWTAHGKSLHQAYYDVLKRNQ